jgi:biopolymer transport protein ExbD
MLHAKVYFRMLALTAIAFLAPLVEAVSQTSPTSTPTVINIRADGEIELNGSISGSLGNLKELNERLTRLFSEGEASAIGQPDTTQKTRPCYSTPVVIRADESLNYGSFADLIVEVRRAGADPINVAASYKYKDLLVTVPQEPCPEQDLSLLKPNPFTLVVTITSDGKLFLNRNQMGSTADTSILTKLLSDVFLRRAKRGDFQPGSLKVEKTLFVKGARSLSLSVVMKIIDAVLEAGADPIGLQIDDLIS